MSMVSNALLVAFMLQAIEAQARPEASPPIQKARVVILSTMLSDDFIGEWGFAALVESNGRRILFEGCPGSFSPETGGIEVRRGFAGAHRAYGEFAAISGPRAPRARKRTATAVPGRSERSGVWGAISGPPMKISCAD